MIICTFLQGSRNTSVFLLSELTGCESRFLVNLLITTIWANNHHLPSFSASSIPYPSSIPLWESQESLSTSSWILKVLRCCIFLEFDGLQACYIVFQWQISSKENYLRLLLITCAPKSFIKEFIHFYLFLNFSYLQTLWLVKCYTIYTDFDNNCMLWSNHFLFFSSSGNWLATQFNLFWLQ